MEERRNRIRAALFAYAYEVENISLVEDAEFDALCRRIQPNVSTGNEEMDKFFASEFSPSTGMWIHRHPQLAGIKRIFESLTGQPVIKTQFAPAADEPKMNTRDITGYNSYTMNMLYLACLGFPVVPGTRQHTFKKMGVTLVWDDTELYLVQGEKRKDLTLEEAAKTFFS